MVGWKRIAELLELSNKNSESLSNYLHRLRNRESMSQLRENLRYLRIAVLSQCLYWYYCMNRKYQVMVHS